jgi:hypothetical protein
MTCFKEHIFLVCPIWLPLFPFCFLCNSHCLGPSSIRCWALNSQPPGHETSALTTRPRLLAIIRAQLKDGNLLVIEGYDGPEYLKNTEMLAERGWEGRVPPLPVTIAHHCMLTVNSTTVFVVGETQNGLVSGRTFYFTFGAETWTEGPELKFTWITTAVEELQETKRVCVGFQTKYYSEAE